MPKKKTSIKKPQVRRCGLCHKVGHNQSTCTAKMTRHTAPPKTATQPLKFFIHHVNYQSAPSAHVVNLKNEKEGVWNKVSSSAPEEAKNQDYYFYHNQLHACRFGDMECEKIAQRMRTEAPEKTEAITAVKTEGPATAIPKAPKLKQKKAPFSPLLAAKKIGAHCKQSLRQTKVRAQKILKRHFAPRRLVAAAIILAIIFLLPGPARTYYSDLTKTTRTVASNGTDGFASLQESTTALMRGDIVEAQKSLAIALKNFNFAVDTLEKNHTVIQTIASKIPLLDDKVTGGQKLISAGRQISLANTNLLNGLSEIKANPSSTVSHSLDVFGSHLAVALPDYQKAATDLALVDPDILPFEYQDSFKEFRILYNAFLKDLQELNTISRSAKEIFGGSGLRRYLLVFQNPAEIRPTGGFIGSIAVIDIKDGSIVKLDVPAGGSYDLQGQLNQFVEPPAPLLLSNKRWEFQDANWFPDFPASAEKMMWFYRHSRNMSVDGVIAINASVLTRLLSIIGPVNDTGRNLTLTQGNALATIQDVVEFGPEKKDNKPKQILADLAPAFLASFQNIDPRSTLNLLANLQEALEQKEIQAYFADENTEYAIKEFGWGGQILHSNSDQDYLFVVNTNIQGQKSDAKINQTVSHQAIVQPDGTILDSVTITREHTGLAEEKMYGSANIDYLRVYVPAGSELVSASGFVWPDEQKFKAPDKWTVKDDFLAQKEKEISIEPISGTRVTSEFGKTAFGNWIITEPGNTSQVQFVYKLPFKAWSETDAATPNRWARIFQSSLPISKYQLIAQRQSGIDGQFESQVIYPDGWKPVWQEGANMKLAVNGAYIEKLPLVKDGVWSMIMSRGEQ
jgi:hypothetical protein